jgi:hypothetical protein
MKKTLETFILSLLISFASAQNLPKVFINYVSHNEDSYSYLNNSNSYYNIRLSLIQFAKDCKLNGAKWSFGSDYILLQAVAKLDTGNVLLNTNNKNLLKWLQEDMDVECDPHSHEKLYNYADVAYLHTVIGVTPTKVVSGFLYDTLQNGNSWTEFQNPVTGDTFSTYTWIPEILWGGGSPGHFNDPIYFGVWKPDAMGNFFTHNPNNHLINYGIGCGITIEENDMTIDIIDQIDYLLDALQNGDAPSNGFYCMSMFIKESDFSKPGFLIKLDSISNAINQRVAQNKIEWKHIVDIIDDWKTNYNEKGFYVSCDFQDVLAIDENESENDSGQLSIYPNPTYGLFIFEWTGKPIDGLEILNFRGSVLYRKSFARTEKNYESIDLSQLAPGIYLIKAYNNKNVFIKKLIIH